MRKMEKKTLVKILTSFENRISTVLIFPQGNNDTGNMKCILNLLTGVFGTIITFSKIRSTEKVT